MADKPGPSKRSGSVLTSDSRAKIRRSFNADSSLDDFECSSVEAEFSQRCDEDDEDDEKQVSDDMADSIFDTRCRIAQKRMDRFESPSRQKTSKPEETFARPLPPDRHMATSPSIIQNYGELSDISDHLLNVTNTPLVSMLMSDAVSVNFPSEDIQILPSGSSASVETSQNRGLRLDNQPSEEGATSFWSSQGTMKIIEFSKTQELLVPAPSDPFEAFQLLVDDNILDLIVHETNANATRILNAPGVRQHSRIIAWKDITRAELLTFLGLVLHAGTIRLNRLSDYWKKHWLFNIPCFAQYMSRDRFMIILRCLHFSSETNEEDRLAKICPIVDHFNNRMNEIYYPGKQLSLDESMVLWGGRLQFRQYIKNKRNKYGVKLHVLAESDSTVLKFAPPQNVLKTMRWYKKIFFHTLQMSLSNAFHLYNKYSMNNKMNLYEFRLHILEKLLPKPPEIAEKMSTKHILTKIENVKTRQKKEGNKTRAITEVVRKECKSCREKKNRVATLYECKSCIGKPGFCIECFFEVHL